MNTLPTYRDCDQLFEDDQTLNALQAFIYKYEAENQVEILGAEPFREDLSRAITFAEERLLNILIERAKETQGKPGFYSIMLLIRDLEACIYPGSRIKNGHLCGALCQVCKHENDYV